MIKILKKVTLNAPASTSTPSTPSASSGQTGSGQTGVDPTKGTQTNPYTWDEFKYLFCSWLWNGGWVEGIGYISADIYGSLFSDSDSFHSGWWWPEDEAGGNNNGNQGNGGNQNSQNGNQGNSNTNGGSNNGGGNDGGNNGNGAKLGNNAQTEVSFKFYVGQDINGNPIYKTYRADYVMQKTGKIIINEVKFGNSTSLTQNQKLLFSQMGKGKVSLIPIGKNALQFQYFKGVNGSGFHVNSSFLNYEFHYTHYIPQ